MDIYIPELSTPKNITIGFRVNEEDKKIIDEFIKRKNYRMSAFCRVAVLLYIKNELEKEKQ